MTEETIKNILKAEIASIGLESEFIDKHLTVVYLPERDFQSFIVGNQIVMNSSKIHSLTVLKEVFWRQLSHYKDGHSLSNLARKYAKDPIYKIAMEHLAQSFAVHLMGIDSYSEKNPNTGSGYPFLLKEPSLFRTPLNLKTRRKDFSVEEIVEYIHKNQNVEYLKKLVQENQNHEFQKYGFKPYFISLLGSSNLEEIFNNLEFLKKHISENEEINPLLMDLEFIKKNYNQILYQINDILKDPNKENSLENFLKKLDQTKLEENTLNQIETILDNLYDTREYKNILNEIYKIRSLQNIGFDKVKKFLKRIPDMKSLKILSEHFYDLANKIPDSQIREVSHRLNQLLFSLPIFHLLNEISFKINEGVYEGYLTETEKNEFLEALHQNDKSFSMQIVSKITKIKKVYENKNVYQMGVGKESYEQGVEIKYETPWNIKLKKILNLYAKKNRINRKFLSTKFSVFSYHQIELRKAYVVIDVSGSMSKKTLDKALHSLRNKLNPCNVYIQFYDTQNLGIFTLKEILKRRKYPRGGGTNINGMINSILNHSKKYKLKQKDLKILITDLQDRIRPKLLKKFLKKKSNILISSDEGIKIHQIPLLPNVIAIPDNEFYENF